MKKSKYLFLSTIFGLTFSFLLYFYVFQHPIYISKRALFVSFFLGMGSALFFYIINKGKITRIDFSRKIPLKKTIFMTAVITVLFLTLFTIPTNYLLAPTVDLIISIPANIENNTVKIKSIYSGIQDISLNGQNIILTHNAIQTDNGITLNSDPISTTSVSWKGRAWDRIFITITNIKLGDDLITFTVNGKNDVYSPPIKNQDEEAITTLKVPENSFYKTVSFISVSLCLFLSIMFLSIQFEITFFKKEHDRDNFLKMLMYLAVLIYVFVSMFPQSPKYRFPNLDSSTYLYVGKGLLQGKMPYKDIWDNKGPVLYFINAIGLSIDLGDWGVWLVQVLFVIASCVLLIKLIQPQSGYLAALVIVILFLRTFTLRLKGGNFTEEYAACFYLLGIFLFWQYLQTENDRKQSLFLFLIGIVTACSFLTRPNLISPFLAIAVTIVIEGLASKKLSSAIKGILKIGGGFILVFGFICLFFVFRHALYDFLDAVFLYNFSYSDTSGQALSKSILLVFNLYPAVMHFACIGCLVILMCFALRKNDIQNNSKTFLISTILGFSFELLIYNMSGRNYDHYTFALLALAYLLIGLSFGLMVSLLKDRGSFIKIRENTISFLVILLILGLNKTILLINEITEKDDQIYREVKAYLNENNYLTVWGFRVDILNELDSKSPSNFIFFPPLYVCDYGSQEMVADYISQIEKTKSVVIDAMSSDPTYAIDANHNTLTFSCSKLLPFYEFMSDSYEEVGKLSNGYSIYQVKK